MSESTIDGTCVEKGLKVEGFQFAYTSVFGDEKFAVKNINFQMEPGYIYGLVGRNGAGKTTFIESLVKGEYMKGHVSLNGISMEDNSLQVKENLGIISYPAKLLQNESLQANGEFLGGIYANWNQQKYEKKLKEFGLEKNQLVKNLSKGEIMKAQMAFIWGYKPQIIIADEPTSGLDPKFRKIFIQTLQEYVEDGEHSVLFSTHITEDLDQVADYLMVLHEGKLLCNGSLEELRDYYKEDNFSVSWLLRKLT